MKTHPRGRDIPDTLLLPSQTPATRPLTPEGRLLWALLENTIVLLGSRPRFPKDHLALALARAWIAPEARRAPPGFSLQDVADYLHLDVDALRARLSHPAP